MMKAEELRSELSEQLLSKYGAMNEALVGAFNELQKNIPKDVAIVLPYSFERHPDVFVTNSHVIGSEHVDSYSRGIAYSVQGFVYEVLGKPVEDNILDAGYIFDKTLRAILRASEKLKAGERILKYEGPDTFFGTQKVAFERGTHIEPGKSDEDFLHIKSQKQL